METTRAPAVGSWSEHGSCLQNRMKDGDGKSLKERAGGLTARIPADQTVLPDRNEKRKSNLPNSDAMLFLVLVQLIHLPSCMWRNGCSWLTYFTNYAFSHRFYEKRKIFVIKKLKNPLTEEEHQQHHCSECWRNRSTVVPLIPGVRFKCILSRRARRNASACFTQPLLPILREKQYVLIISIIFPGDDYRHNHHFTSLLVLQRTWDMAKRR